jgi:hypothetical protein
MSTIVTRAGKGSPLTNTEVDSNFTNLNTDKIEAATTVTLTNKTLTSPRINEILDTSGNEILGLSATASATDFLTVKNGIGVGVPLHIYADGSSTNVGLHIQPKGSGLVTISDGTDFNKGIRFRSSSSSASAVTLIDAVSTAGRVVTLPDATTTLVGRDTTDTLTNKTIAFSSNTFSGTLGTANGGTNLTSFTSGGVVYASSTSALATGSALTFSGTNLGVSGNGTFNTGASGGVVSGNSTYSGYFEALGGGSGATITITPSTISGANGVIYNTSFVGGGNGPHVFQIGGTEGMRLTTTGLGIGSTAPTASLSILNSISGAKADFVQNSVTTGEYTGISFAVTAATGSGFKKGALFFERTGSNSVGKLHLANNAAPDATNATLADAKLTIDSAGNVGIGTTSPDANLTVNGAASFSAGTAALPAIARAGDLNTGIWFPAADTIAFTEGGVESMRITSAGDLLVGRTSAPADGFARIAVINSTDTAIQLTKTGVISCRVTAVTSALTFGVDGADGTTERGRFDSSGAFRVKGAGTAGSTDAFQVSGSAPASAMILEAGGNLNLGASGGSGRYFGINTNGSSTGAFLYNDTAQTILSAAAAVPLLFRTNNTERARIDSSGNLMVGTTSAAGVLTVVGANTSDGPTAKYIANIRNSGAQTSGVGAGIAFTQTMSSFNAVLCTIQGIKENATSDNYASALSFYTRANGADLTERARIDSSGNFMVGTTTNTNTSKLVVNGTISQTVGGTQYLVVDQSDIGTGANEIPLNQYLGNLAYEDNTNLPSVGVGAGTAALPSVFNATDNDTGLYFPAANEIALSTNGLERWRVDSSGNMMVGTTTAVGRINVVGGGVHAQTCVGTGSADNYGDGAGLMVSYVGGVGNLRAYSNTSGTGTTSISITTSGNEAARFDSLGNLGIGTSSPSTFGKFAVSSGATANAAYLTSTAGSAYSAGSFFANSILTLRSGANATGNATAIRFASANNGALEGLFGYVQNASAYGDFVWQGFNGSYGERMRLDSAGNLGLGVTPSAIVSDFRGIEVGSVGNGVYGGSSGYDHTMLSANAYPSGASVACTYGSNGLAGQYRINSGVHYWLTAPTGTAGNPITFTQAMTLDASGNLLVGLTSASNGKISLAVPSGGGWFSSKTGASTENLFGSDGNGNASIFTTGGTHTINFYTNNTERMRISSAGDVAIGTNPYYSHKLAVNGTTVTQNLYINASVGGPQTGFVNDGGTTTTSKALAITNSSGVELQVNYYGGQSKFRSTIGVGDTAGSTSGAGITFPATQSASSDANTLDDYEEGTWTPTLGDGTTTVNMSGGTYIKIGKYVLVNFDGYNKNYSALSASGHLRIGGLPFTVGTAAHAALATNNTGGNTSVVEANGTLAYMYTSNGNVDWAQSTRNSLVGGASTFSVRGQFMYIANS